jgi:hypothetical protein
MTTYKEKIEASEHRAHDKIIATKIARDMGDLRSKVENSPTISRRWIWELIQNAKDVAYSSGVNIRVSFKEHDAQPRLIFKHNGKPFSADNIRYLIEQISSKDREKDETGKQKTTGKFGTGFLTTHMLSETVTVASVAKEEGLDYRKFNLILDRSGTELEDIIEAVENSRRSISNLDDLDSYSEFDANNYNTAFSYPLEDALSIQVAKNGLADLESCLLYTLCFVSSIKSVELPHLDTVYFNPESEEPVDDTIEIIELAAEKGSDSVKYTVAKMSNGLTSIAIPVAIKDGEVSILAIENNVPKLFCDFPLIGTEEFPFPVIINNPNFNPTDPRDGVSLTDTSRPNQQIADNKKIIKEAIELYLKLLDIASEENWHNLHLLAKVTPVKAALDWVSQKWFNDEVLNPVRKKLLTAKIVRTASSGLAAILSEDGKQYMWFPSGATKEIREQTWIVSEYWFPHCLPPKDDIELWAKLAWADCGRLTLDQLAVFVEAKATVQQLAAAINGIDVYEWLNKFYDVLRIDDKEFHSIMDKRLIIPNQKESLAKKAALSKDKGDIPTEFKEILEGFGAKLRERLASQEIEMNFDNRVIDLHAVVREIIAEVSEKANDREQAKNYRDAFNRLLIYFKKHPEESKALFSHIYMNKHLLYNDEEILNNIDKAEQLDDLFKEFKVVNITDLRALIEQAAHETNTLVPVTQEIILSMGITSLEEWKTALEDKDLEAMFSHESVPTPDMFIYAQSHIETAKRNIITHLESLPEYDLSDMDEDTASTILAGVYKNHLPISIVIRPAFKSEVIIYYGSERDVLDYEPSELWIDDGRSIRMISLGHILKTAKIRKFPV